jgi:hypothetical protein
MRGDRGRRYGLGGAAPDVAAPGTFESDPVGVPVVDPSVRSELLEAPVEVVADSVVEQAPTAKAAANMAAAVK